MKRLKASNQFISTILAFALIPISGFALDIYIPSLPDMAVRMHASPAAIQFTISAFLITYGLGQLLIGGVLDSYGRYLPNMISLAVFSIASFAIAWSNNLEFIYIMRALQGLAAAVIIVSKRALFFDLYTGEKLKHYASLFSIIWSLAPIIAPFVGGYFQTHFGWQSNFYFLGFFGLAFFALELIFSGETLQVFQAFRFKKIAGIYKDMLRTRDFTSGMVVLGLAYGTLMLYNMASPFIIEKLLHYPATVTGTCSLISGVSVLFGALLSKLFIAKPLVKKITTVIALQIIAVVALMTITGYVENIYTLLAYVITLHLFSGFIFNSMLAYCLTRFSSNGGMASGLVGGGFIIFTSALSYAVVSIVSIKSQVLLGVGYSVLILGILIFFLRTKWIGRENDSATDAQVIMAE
ncbi:MAG: MFS transporter [Filimonas sp.]|nr:MFS transporter [Filimonas sp.]